MMYHCLECNKLVFFSGKNAGFCKECEEKLQREAIIKKENERRRKLEEEERRKKVREELQEWGREIEENDAYMRQQRYQTRMAERYYNEALKAFHASAFCNARDLLQMSIDSYPEQSCIYKTRSLLTDVLNQIKKSEEAAVQERINREQKIMAASTPQVQEIQMPQSDMKNNKPVALSCEICGSSDILRQNGVFVCQGCGVQYSSNELKIMLNQRMKQNVTVVYDTNSINNSQNTSDLFLPFTETYNEFNRMIFDFSAGKDEKIIEQLKERLKHISTQKEGCVESGWKIGDIIKFGNYTQKLWDDNEFTPIEWIVFGIYKGRALLVSKKILFSCVQVGEYEPSCWLEESNIRVELNLDFYLEAFNEEERKTICLTYNDAWERCRFGYNNITEYYSTDDMLYVKDLVFVLSIAEASKDRPNGDLSPMLDYTEATGWANLRKDQEWWMRTDTPDCEEGVIAKREPFSYSFEDGTEWEYNFLHSSKRGSHGVRPAIWIDISEYEKRAPSFRQYDGTQRRMNNEEYSSSVNHKSPPPDYDESDGYFDGADWVSYRDDKDAYK